MKLSLLIGLATLLIASVLVIGAGCEQEETGSVVQEFGPQTYKIDLIDFDISPRELTIKVGDSVTWTNQGSAKHDVRSNDGSFYSIPLETGESYTFTFNQAGTFKYKCGLHPGVEGAIIVE